MTAPAGYVDAYTFLRDWLTAAAVIPGLNVARKRADGTFPTPLPYRLPILFPAVIGGSDDTPGIDASTVDLDLLAADVESAARLARQLQFALRFTLPGYRQPDGMAWCADVRTVSKPAPRPYDTTAIGRFGQSVRIFLRTRFTTP